MPEHISISRRYDEADVMLLEFIGRYFKYLWVVFGLIAVGKILLSYILTHAYPALVFAIFKWYNSDEQQIEEDKQQRFVMKTLNLITVLLYFTLLVALADTLLLAILGK